MTDAASLLPPAATTLEQALEQVAARAGDIGLPLSDLWNPATCPPEYLPWLAWGLSIDFWDADWTVAEKRTAIAATLTDQMAKGTPHSLRAVLDRFDPLIQLVEWFDANPRLDPYTIMLELPLPAVSSVTYDQALITALLRDIAQVKPVRVHMLAAQRLIATAGIWIQGAAQLAVHLRVSGTADETVEPAWATYLQTEDGEPLTDDAGNFLEVD